MKPTHSIRGRAIKETHSKPLAACKRVFDLVKDFVRSQSTKIFHEIEDTLDCHTV
ncbi:MAG: hypothetical protein KZQ63_11820 [Candidatus Thiodiazotropha sp. (ex Lucinoma aequizonata)]|nr:hypothetical protein [Candidatus Thiodiazotropha sp. (ex Lucinoma aequizonata)]MCU7898526.1 hypothetical protein [Candidatus Thiodiazotropha sp. (ex Lucinoma aequizonata)]MCU7912648.1 hypothetical protein [Candidatus Thiodiazotropha sp. (ex Lucinoma aequizonata)]